MFNIFCFQVISKYYEYPIWECLNKIDQANIDAEVHGKEEEAKKISRKNLNSVKLSFQICLLSSLPPVLGLSDSQGIYPTSEYPNYPLWGHVVHSLMLSG